MTRPAMHPVRDISTQDACLLRQYLHVLAGADREHGAHVAKLHAAYIARGMAATGYSFVGFVARLVEIWAGENAR